MFGSFHRRAARKPELGCLVMSTENALAFTWEFEAPNQRSGDFSLMWIPSGWPMTRNQKSSIVWPLIASPSKT